MGLCRKNEEEERPKEKEEGEERSFSNNLVVLWLIIFEVFGIILESFSGSSGQSVQAGFV